MNNKKNCRLCWWELVRDEEKLKRWLAEVLGAEFRYQWSRRDELGREEPGLVHPNAYRRWLEEGPCVNCPCELRCNAICSLRAKWWDAKMEKVRRQMGAQ